MSNGSERTPEHDDGLEVWSDPFSDFVDPRPTARVGGDNFDSLRSRIAALEAENDKLNKAARAAVRRLEKAAQYCGDPQHPIWDGDRTSAEARRRVDGLVDILDPFRPELEDASDEDWDRIYKLDPIDAYVSDYEERAEARIAALEAVIEQVRETLLRPLDPEKVLDNHAGRALWKAWCNSRALEVLDAAPSTVLDGMIREAKAEAKAEAERDALRAQLDGMTVKWGVGYAGVHVDPMRDEEEAREYHSNMPGHTLVTRLVGPWTEAQ